MFTWVSNMLTVSSKKHGKGTDLLIFRIYDLSNTTIVILTCLQEKHFLRKIVSRIK